MDDQTVGPFIGHSLIATHQVEHVLVVEQPDEVERPEGGSGTERQITDHHRTGIRVIFFLSFC